MIQDPLDPTVGLGPLNGDGTAFTEPAYPYGKLPHGIASDPRLNPVDRNLAMALLHWAWAPSDRCAVSDWRLADYVGVSVPTIRRSLSRLEELGLIGRERVPYTAGNSTGRMLFLRWIADPSLIATPPAHDAPQGRTRSHDFSCTHRSPMIDPGVHPSLMDDRLSPCETAPIAHGRSVGSITSERQGRSPVSDKEEEERKEKNKHASGARMVKPMPRHKDPDFGQELRPVENLHGRNHEASEKPKAPGSNSPEAIELAEWARHHGGDGLAFWVQAYCDQIPAEWLRLLIQRKVIGQPIMPDRRRNAYLGAIVESWIVAGRCEYDSARGPKGSAKAARRVDYNQPEMAARLEQKVNAIIARMPAFRNGVKCG